MGHCLGPGVSIPAHEERLYLYFISNPNGTHLVLLIKVNLIDFTSPMSNLEPHSTGYLQIGFGGIPSSGVNGIFSRVMG